MQTIEEIAEAVRLLYPKAVSVNLFVSVCALNVEERREYKTDGSSWTMLNGKQAPRKDDDQP